MCLPVFDVASARARSKGIPLSIDFILRFTHAIFQQLSTLKSYFSKISRFKFSSRYATSRSCRADYQRDIES